MEAEERADQGLGRTGEGEEFAIGIGREIGRHGERQHQRPGEHAPSGEIVIGGEPGGDDAHAGGEKRDTGHHPGGGLERDGEHIARKMRPVGTAARQRQGDECQEGDENRDTTQECPAREEAMLLEGGYGASAPLTECRSLHFGSWFPPLPPCGRGWPKAG